MERNTKGNEALGSDTSQRAIERMTEGRQRIRQRYATCNCGCHGQDSWHATFIKRCVRDIVAVADPGSEQGHQVVARGTYQHPSGDRRPCTLEVFNFGGGRWATSGMWTWDGAK